MTNPPLTRSLLRGGLGLALLLTLALAAPALGAARGTGGDGRPTPADGTPVVGADRPDAKGEATPVPIAVTTAVAPAGLDAATPLPGGSVPWAAVAAPPAHGAGGGMLQGGGGGAPQLRYYALDALGSVRVVFDAAGQVVSRADYEPFGAAVPASTTGTLPRQQFTGQERDGEVGVDYFGARTYAPSLGRFLSVDPAPPASLDRPQRFNRYVYAMNKPTQVVDPDGRTEQCDASQADCDLGQIAAPVDRAGGEGGYGGVDWRFPSEGSEVGEFRIDVKDYTDIRDCRDPRGCGRGGGGGVGQLYPRLPAKTEKTLRDALARVASLVPRSECTTHVLSKLPSAIGTSPGARAGGFTLEGFQSSLADARFVDGRTSAAQMTPHVYPAGVSGTVAAHLANNPGVTAITSVTAGEMTTFLSERGIANYTSASGEHAAGFVMHEALHWYLGRVDSDLSSSLFSNGGGPTGTSSDITSLISARCF